MTPPPGVGAILFAEVPCFYAAVERADDPTLRGRPLIVGGDPRKRGQVQSASADALAAGVSEGMPVLEALGLCPAAKTVRTNMKRYREVSGLLRTCLRAEVDALEPMGLESAFLAGRVGADSEIEIEAEALAQRLVDRVEQSLGLPLRVGVARVKFLARLAAQHAGEAGLYVVAQGAESDFLHAMPLDRLPGVGPRTLETLETLGARGVADLRELGAEKLEAALGNHGLRLLELARGEDPSPIRATQHPQTLSRESTFKEAQLDMSALWERLQELSQILEEALRTQALEARGVSVKVRYEDDERSTRRRTLGRSIASASEIYTLASALLDRTHAGSRPIALLGVSLSGLRAAREPDGQLDLFDLS